jgi:hypothetical protein
VPPSPKSQAHGEIVPADESVKLTVRGDEPDTGVAEKLATGGAAETVIVLDAVVLPPLPVTVRVTV